MSNEEEDDGKLRDAITGRKICKTLNKSKMDKYEMDDYFLGG